MNWKVTDLMLNQGHQIIRRFKTANHLIFF
jgi:hypothetical protein